MSWAGVKRRDLLIIISRITHNRKNFQSCLRIKNASSVWVSPTHNTLIITLDVFCLLIMFTRQSSCFVHFSWFSLMMASQSNGLGFVVPWRGMHEVLFIITSMCSPIDEGLYPGPCGIRACTATYVSASRGPGPPAEARVRPKILESCGRHSCIDRLIIYS